MGFFRKSTIVAFGARRVKCQRISVALNSQNSFFRHCEKNYNECSPADVCYPGIKCVDLNNDFSCECDNCDDMYCDCNSGISCQEK